MNIQNLTLIMSRITQKISHYWHIDKNEKLVEFAQTLLGKIFMFVVLSGIFYTVDAAAFHDPTMNIIILLSCFIFAYFPKQRTIILPVATLAVLLAKPYWYGLDYIIHMFIMQNVSVATTKMISLFALATFFLFVFSVLMLGRKKKNLFIFKYPIRTLLLMLAVFYFSSFCYWNIYLIVFISCLFYIFKAYIWYFIYALAEVKLKNPPAIEQQMGHFKNFWCGLSSTIPVGKGAHYLNSKLAKNDRELAINQLKAVKLIFWCVIIIGNVSNLLVHIMNHYHIDKIEHYQLMFRNGDVFSVSTGWLSLIYSVVNDALQLCFGGNIVVAFARFSGFNLPRFMYRPLGSRTLVDFWNRYHYYFKELLVDLFFFPTFLKYFKKQPTLRLIFATFMAAGVGNFLFHFLKYGNLLYVYDIASYTELFSSYIFYCVLLTIGICVSQYRINHGRIIKDDILSRVTSFSCVWGFVIGVYLFGNESLAFTFMERIKFMGLLFGITI